MEGVCLWDRFAHAMFCVCVWEREREREAQFTDLDGITITHELPGLVTQFRDLGQVRAVV